MNHLVLEMGLALSLIAIAAALSQPLRLHEVAARTGAGLVVMHTRAAPKEERFPGYGGDVVADDLLRAHRPGPRATRAHEDGFGQSADSPPLEPVSYVPPV